MHHAIRAWATEQHLHTESPAEPSLDPRTDPVAIFDQHDPDRRTYRYALSRCWDPSLTAVTYVVLNPSTAGALHARDDDRTIWRCRTFATDAGYDSMIVVNLFALIAKEPEDLYQHPDPVGPANDALLELIASLDGHIILAWGTKHSSRHGRGATVFELLTRTSRPLLTLGLNNDGSPKHPLYLKATTVPVPYARPALGGTEPIQPRLDGDGQHAGAQP
jgi:hypothetical protein